MSEVSGLRSVLHPPEKVRVKPDQPSQSAWVWVLGLFLLGLALRVSNLDLKTAWMDEVSTVIFSLLPIDQLVDLDALLQPIRAHAEATPLDSARFLLQENNHPPLYFMLAHVWMDLFSTDNVTASLGLSASFRLCGEQRRFPLSIGRVGKPSSPSWRVYSVRLLWRCRHSVCFWPKRPGITGLPSC